MTWNIIKPIYVAKYNILFYWQPKKHHKASHNLASQLCTVVFSPIWRHFLEDGVIEEVELLRFQIYFPACECFWNNTFSDIEWRDSWLLWQHLVEVAIKIIHIYPANYKLAQFYFFFTF